MDKNSYTCEEEIIENAILIWLNLSFQKFENNKIESINKLRNPMLSYSILNEIDSSIFNLDELPDIYNNTDDSSIMLSWSHLLNDIKSFYNDVLNIELKNEEEYKNIKVRELVQDNSKTSLIIYVSELILGIAVSCESRANYIEILQEIEDEEIKEILYCILEKRIKINESKEILNKSSNNRINNYNENNFYYNNNDEEYQETDFGDNNYNNMGYIERINSLEKENSNLLQELEKLREEKIELKIANQSLSEEIDELKIKLEEEIYNLNNYKDTANSLAESNINIVTYEIQISELKGRNAENENTIKKLKEEKVKLNEEYKDKIFNLNKELNKFKEKAAQLDYINKKLDHDKITIKDLFTIKIRYNQLESKLKDNENKIKALRSVDNCDTKLLHKKIEELNSIIIKEKNQYEELARIQTQTSNKYSELEINYNKLIKELKESNIDINEFNKNLELLKHNNKECNNNSNKNSTINYSEIINDNINTDLNLQNIEQDDNQKQEITDLQVKLKVAIVENSNLKNSLSELNIEFKKLKESYTSKEHDFNIISSKLEKYKKKYEDYEDNLKKVSELSSKNFELLSSIDSVKLKNIEEISELKSNHKNQLLELKHERKEKELELVNLTNTLKNENLNLESQLQSLNNILETKNALIEEYKKNSENYNSLYNSNTTSLSNLNSIDNNSNNNNNNALKVLEKRITDQNNKMLEESKLKIKELEEANFNLKEANNKFKSTLVELNEKLEKHSQKDKDYPLEKFEELEYQVKYLERELEIKLKDHEEQMDLISSVIYTMGVEYLASNVLKNYNSISSYDNFMKEKLAKSDNKFSYNS